MVIHDGLYSRAEIYDIAFDFRDVAQECDFLTEVFQTHNNNEPQSFLELAAGPALHCREFARRGLDVCALDLSEEMVAYGLQQARKHGVSFRYEHGDMVSFDLGQTFDLVAILMDSTSYLLDNDAVLDNLECVANHLNPGGLYLLEMTHPKWYVFKVGPPIENKWEMERDGKKVEMRWGYPDDAFDPITQITHTRVTTTITIDDKSETIEEIGPQRCFTTNEFEALVRASGRFRIAELFGAMDGAIPFSNDKKAWRMVPVLQKL